MISLKNFNVAIILLVSSILLMSCNGKLPGADARKYPADPKKRIEKNLSEGRGFRLSNMGGKSKGGVFEFASSNELWKATLDTIDFMPLASVNYSGGIIITDWYSSNQNTNESIKISIRFLTNEIRSDAVDVKVFIKKCSSLSSCLISEKQGDISFELKKKILKTAAAYKAEKKSKKSKPYIYNEPN